MSPPDVHLGHGSAALPRPGTPARHGSPPLEIDLTDSAVGRTTGTRRPVPATAGPTTRVPVDPPVRGAKAGALAVDLVPGLEAVEALETEWLALFAAGTQGNPNLHPAWVLGWYRTFVPPRDVVVVAVRHGDRLVGVAPLWWQRSTARGGPRLSLQLAGAGRHVHLTDLPGVLSADPLHRKVLSAIGGALEAMPGWHWATLTLAPEQGWSDGLMRSAAAVAVPRVGRTSVVTVLPVTAEEFTRGLKRNVRESIRRSTNRLDRSGSPWRIDRVDSGSNAFPMALGTLARLNRTRADLTDRRRHASVFLAGRYLDFLHAVARRPSAAGLLSIYQLRLAERVVAAQLVVHDPVTTLLVTSGMTAAAWEYSPMAVLIREVAIDAVRSGRSFLNHSPGPDVSKLRWSEHLVTHHEVTFCRTAPLSRGLHRAYAHLALEAGLLREQRRNAAGPGGTG